MNRFRENLLSISIEQQGKSTVLGRKVDLLTGSYYNKMKDLARQNDIDMSKSSIVLKGEVSLNWIIVYLTCLFNNVRLILVPNSLTDREALYICYKEGSFLYVSGNAPTDEDIVRNYEHSPLICTDDLHISIGLTNKTGCPNTDIFRSLEWNDSVIMKAYNNIHNFRSSWVGYSLNNLKYAASYFAKYAKIGTNYQYVLKGDLYMEHANVILGLLDNSFRKTIFIPTHSINAYKKVSRSCSGAKVICSKEDFERSFRHTDHLIEYSNPWLHSIKNTPLLNRIYWQVFKKKLKSIFGTSVNDIIILGGLDSAMIHNAVESKLRLNSSYTFSTIQTTGCAILIRHGDRKTCELAQQISLFDTDFPSKGGTIIISGDTAAFEANEFQIKGSIFVDTEYYGEHTEGGIIPISPVKDIVLGKFDLTVNAKNLEDLTRDMPYVKDIMLFLFKDEYYLLAYPDVDKCKKNNIDSVTLNKIFENYKNLLNIQLGEHYQIKRVVIFPRMFNTEDKFLFRSLFK